MDLGDEAWLPLCPFVMASNCPRCLRRETYFTDRRDDRKRIALMRSFERGYTEQGEQVARAVTALVADHPDPQK